jgi:hypothetical protein
VGLKNSAGLIQRAINFSAPRDTIDDRILKNYFTTLPYGITNAKLRIPAVFLAWMYHKITGIVSRKMVSSQE